MITVMNGCNTEPIEDTGSRVEGPYENGLIIVDGGPGRICWIRELWVPKENPYPFALKIGGLYYEYVRDVRDDERPPERID